MKRVLLYALFLLPQLLFAEEIVQPITFKCVGEAERFSQFIDELSDQEFERLNAQGLLVTVDTEPTAIYRLPVELIDDERFSTSASTRVFQILPGASISTSEITFPMQECGWLLGTNGRGVKCKLAPSSSPSAIIEINELRISPPYWVNFRMVYAAHVFRKYDDYRSVVGTYYYENFHSTDCEVIDPIPDKEIWFN